MTDLAARISAEVPGAVLEAVLKSDRYATTARVLLADGRRAVWKRGVVVLPPGVHVAAAARALARREADHLERLRGVPGVPALLARPAADSFVRQWIDGRTLRETQHVPDGFFPALREVVAAIHAEGVAYADLAKEENVIVDDAGRPWLVDFQIAASAGTWLGPLVPRLMRADRYHLARHVKRRRPDQLDAADLREIGRGHGALSALHRALVKKPYNLVTRRIVKRWSGAGEGRRPGEPRGLRDAGSRRGE